MKMVLRLPLRYIAALFVLLGVLPCHALAGQKELPSLAPVVTSVFPHGAQRGSTVEVDFLGQNLHDAESLTFVGSDLETELVSATSTKLRVRVMVGPRAEVGRRDFRLQTPYGSFVGVFDIGSIRETNEVEPNTDPRKAQTISLPVLVNGVIESEDFDHFQVHVQDDETVFFDVNASRNGSKLDPNLTLLDSAGRELAWTDDDYIYGDSRIEYRFNKGGDYVVRVGSLAGGPDSDYRLVAGRLPYLSLVLPAGVERGKTSELLIQGSFLEDTSEVWLGNHLAEGRVLSRSADSVRVRLTVSGDVPTGKHWLHLAGPLGEAPLPIPLVVSDLPEIGVSRRQPSQARPMEVDTPVAVSGILEAPKASHYFRFKASAKQRYLFQVDSMEYGYHLDPVITLLDESGHKLAFADDPGRDERTDEIELDPHLDYFFERGGNYLIAVRDSMYRGSAQFVYRLMVRPADPDFMLEVREPLKTLHPGEKTEMLLRVRRRGGWDTPIEVWAEDLPEGVLSSNQVVEPKNSIVKDTCGVDLVVDGSIVRLPIQAQSDAVLGRHHIAVKARGIKSGRTVEREALVFYEHLAAGYLFGPMQEQVVDLTIAPVPNVIFNVPDELTIEKGTSAPLKVTLNRFRDATDSQLYIGARDLPPGITATSILLNPQGEELELELSASGDATPQELPIRVTAVLRSGGKVMAESAPILVRVIEKGEEKQ